MSVCKNNHLLMQEKDSHNRNNKRNLIFSSLINTDGKMNKYPDTCFIFSLWEKGNDQINWETGELHLEGGAFLTLTALSVRLQRIITLKIHHCCSLMLLWTSVSSADQVTGSSHAEAASRAGLSRLNEAALYITDTLWQMESRISGLKKNTIWQYVFGDASK